METESFADAWAEYQKAKSPDAKDRFLAFFIPRILGLAKRYLLDKGQKEDVAGSVLGSFVANHQDAFERIQEPAELWKLFAAIAVRHFNKHNKRRQRETKRGPVVRIGVGGAGDSGTGQGFEPVAPGQTPAEEAADNEDWGLCRDLLKQLEHRLAEGDPLRSGRRLAVFGMLQEEKGRLEIAQALNTSVPTVDRDLKVIRAVFEELRVEKVNP